MIAPQPETPPFDLWRTILASLIVMLGTWIFGQVLAPPILAAVKALLP